TRHSPEYYHDHEVRLDWAWFLLLRLRVQTNLLVHGPKIFSLKKRVSILGVIEAKDFALNFDQRLRIANVRAQVGRHLARVAKQSRKGRAVSLNQRILRIENIEVHRAVVRVNCYFDAVANVI